VRSQRARCQTTTRRASGPRSPRWRASTGFQRPPRTETCSHSAPPLPALAAVAVHARQSCIHVPSRPNRRASPLKPPPPAPSGSRTPRPRTPSPAAAARASTTPRCARRAAPALPPRRAAPRRRAGAPPPTPALATGALSLPTRAGLRQAEQRGRAAAGRRGVGGAQVRVPAARDVSA